MFNSFFPVFTAPGAEIFSRLITGWILRTTRRTITGIIPLADPQGRRSHDAYHRFFPDARWSITQLWKILACLLISKFAAKGNIPLAIDDTLFHRSGKKVYGGGFWRDAVRSTRTKIVYAWGLNLVVLTLQVQPPWGGEPLGPAYQTCDSIAKTKKTLIELAVEMLQEVAGWFGSRQIRLVADGFYASLAGWNITNTTIISRMRCDASLFKLPLKRKRPGRGQTSKTGCRIAQTQDDGCVCSQVDAGDFYRSRQDGHKAGVFAKGSLVQGQQDAGAACDFAGSERQGAGRLFFHDRRGDESRRRAGCLRRPVGHRRYFQKYQTVSWRRAVADVGEERPRASSRSWTLAVLDGLAVVLPTTHRQTKVPNYAVVCEQNHTQLRRCIASLAKGSVARTIYYDVRELCRT